ncbi:hypothetical protein EHM69_11070 [candidate division KSB1 bacterium]|nr:MAG: hypothetical protein EHM69_11070 [candidate division KSB1 bacterium]
MIDLHNHVLPGVDDGAYDLEMALRMLDIAAGQGITHVACTPHGHDRMNEETDRLYQSVFLELQKAVEELGIPVQLALGTEIMLGVELLRVLHLPCATYHGAGKYFLLEFPIETPFEIILNVTTTAHRANRRPVLAHFERFARAMRTKEYVKKIREAGAVISLDAGSLVGQFGAVIEKRARQLLEWDVVDLLASDAHNDAVHGFRLKEGYDAAVKILGEEKALKLVNDHPRRVWEGLPWTT